MNIIHHSKQVRDLWVAPIKKIIKVEFGPNVGFLPLIKKLLIERLVECDLCHNEFPAEKVKMNGTGNQFLCEKCGQ